MSFIFSGVLIQFYAYYLALFLVGFFYIYIWTMVRSLYLVMGRVGYTGTSGWTMHFRSLCLVMVRIGYTSTVDLDHGQCLALCLD
jgi:hypothetical protein